MRCRRNNMSFNQSEWLGGFMHDSVTNSLQEPDSVFPVLEATVIPITTVALLTGPRPLFITHLQIVFNDIAVDDPSGDRYLGWSILTASDGTTTPTYASVAAKTANADLPLIHDNSVSTTALQAVANVPVDLFNYVGQTRESPDVMYATQAAMPSSQKRAPVRIAANTLYQVRLGTYLAGSLAAVTGVDNLAVMVYGFRV
jgi:hypothetical protein